MTSGGDPRPYLWVATSSEPHGRRSPSDRSPITHIHKPITRGVATLSRPVLYDDWPVVWRRIEPMLREVWLARAEDPAVIEVPWFDERRGCWDAHRPHDLRLRTDGENPVTCGPDEPSVDVVTEFVHPLTRTVCQLGVGVPYDDFARLWPALVAWLHDGFTRFGADVTSLIVAARTSPGGEG